MLVIQETERQSAKPDRLHSTLLFEPTPHRFKMKGYYKHILFPFVLFAFLSFAGVVTGQPLEVTINYGPDEWIDRNTPLTIQFNRDLTPADGRPSVWIDSNDITGICTIQNDHILYPTDMISLPSGKHTLKVYFVREDEQWSDPEEFPLNVRTIGGFEEVTATPGLTLTNKGQIAEYKNPAEPESERPTFQDVTGQLNLKLLAKKNGWEVDAESQIMGVSFERDALRFRDLEEKAPKIDLARYHITAKNKESIIAAGHLRHGQHRHLLNGFQSRGLMYSQSFEDYLDLNIAGTYASNAVGWSRFTGLTEPGHRIISATAGFEAIETSPGALRLETTAVFGSQKPRNSFNQEAILDSETSRGAGLRILSSFWDRRIRSEASFALSMFRNPNDPALNQDQEVVPVFTENRQAWYGDMSAQLIRNMEIIQRLRLNLRTDYRFTRIDPLYEAVGIFIRGDIEEHQFSAAANAGPLNINMEHRRSEDNLDNLPSVLKTLSRQNNFQVQLPTSNLIKSDSNIPAWLLPNLGYRFNYVHQFGAGVPPEGGFDETHVPDQINHLYQASAAWQNRTWSLSYQFQKSYQNNCQPGRETDDFIRTGHTASFRVKPFSFLDLSTNLNYDLNENMAAQETEVSRKLGFSMQFRPVQTLNFRGAYQPSRTFDRADTRLRTHTRVSLEANWRFQFMKTRAHPPGGTIYLRYSKQQNFVDDPFRDFPDEDMIWTLQSGITLNLF